VSPRNSTDALPTPVPSPVRARRKAPPDIYTLFLAIALVAILLAILFICLYMKDYRFERTGGPMKAMIGLCAVGIRKRFSIPRPY
jgi:hypothetical protein